MRFESLKDFIATGRRWLAKGPVCLILSEDDVELDSTIRHHLRLGFRSVVVFGSGDIRLSDVLVDLGAEEAGDRVVQVVHDMLADRALTNAVNACIKAAPGVWFTYCYNAEYLFFPFCEYRSIGELTLFCAEERRESVLTYVVDLYAADLGAHPDAVSLDTAHLDKSGYYALARKNPQNEVADRQFDFFGGLRWRFEEHIPYARRRIDRVGIFRAAAGLTLGADHLFNLPEFNTYSCPWHNSPTAALCSFRTAKALKRNPGSTYEIKTFHWHNSAPFDWQSQQLLDLGLIEPGQWF